MKLLLLFFLLLLPVSPLLAQSNKLSAFIIAMITKLLPVKYILLKSIIVLHHFSFSPCLPGYPVSYSFSLPLSLYVNIHSIPRIHIRRIKSSAFLLAYNRSAVSVRKDFLHIYLCLYTLLLYLLLYCRLPYKLLPEHWHLYEVLLLPAFRRSLLQ